MMGIPHSAPMQFVVLYPLSFLYFIGDFQFAFNLFIFVHLFLAAVFAFFFFKEMKYSTLASGWGAFNWMMSGYLVSSINLLNILGSVIWLPLVLLLFHRFLSRRDKRYCFWTGLALLMMFLGSEAGITLVTGWLLLGYAVVDGWRKGPKGLSFSLKGWGWTAVLFAGLSAFQWIPSLEYLLQTERVQMSFQTATLWSVPPLDLLNLWSPYITDAWALKQDYWVRQSLFTSYYAGMLPWVFILWLFLELKKTPRVKWLLIGLVCSLIIVLGKHTPVYKLLYYLVPGLSSIRYPVRLFFIPTLLLCWLLVHGCDSFLRFSKRDRPFLRSRSAAYLKISLAGAVLILLFSLEPVSHWVREKLLSSQGEEKILMQISLLNLHGTFQIWIASWLLLWLIAAFPALRYLTLAVLSLILLWDLSGAHKGINHTMPLQSFWRPSKAIEYLKKQEGYFRICPSPNFDLRNYAAPLLRVLEWCVPNSLVSFGIADVTGYDSLYPRRYLKLLGKIVASSSPSSNQLFNLLNARFLLTPKELPKEFTADTWKLVLEGKEIFIYENKKVLPRAFLVPRAVFLSDEDGALSRISAPDFQPSQEVVLEGTPEGIIVENTPSEELPAKKNEENAVIEVYRPNTVKIRVASGRPQFLVLSDAYYPGWKAFLDGKPAPVFRADYYLRSVQVPPGVHEIEWVYRPWWFFWAPGISLLTLFLSLRFFCGLDRKHY